MSERTDGGEGARAAADGARNAIVPATPMDAVRSAVFTVLFYSATTLLSVLYAPLLVLPGRRLAPFCYSWSGFVEALSRHVLRIDCRVETDPAAAAAIAEGPVIYAAKHQSMWETIAFNRLLNRPAFVLKRELTRIPLFGQYLTKLRMIAVDRSAGSAALKTMVRDAQAELAAGRSIVIYPQGTRVSPGAHAPYLPGVAALYTRLDAPVVPVALDSGRFWPRRRFVKRRGTVTVRLLPPIQPGLDRRGFLRTLEERIESACG